jgi:hypothetical protein
MTVFGDKPPRSARVFARGSRRASAASALARLGPDCRWHEKAAANVPSRAATGDGARCLARLGSTAAAVSSMRDPKRERAAHDKGAWAARWE